MAKFYLETPTQIADNKIIVPIYVNTESESINTFEVKLQISDNLIFRDYLEKYSIVSLWVESPYIENNIITFSGIIPGGFIGKKGKLIDLIFEIKDSGNNYYQIKFLPTSQAFLNDGYGTKITPKVSSYFFPLSETRVSQELLVDNYPPDHFKVYLQRDKNLFDNKYFIVFKAKDRQSGIAYYEVAEVQSYAPAKIQNIFQFKKSDSPYILNDQSLRSYVYVKAVDKFGNERIEVLKPRFFLEPSEILFLFIFIYLTVFFIKIYNRIRFKINKDKQDV